MLHEILTIQCIRDTHHVPCRTVTTKTTETTLSTSHKRKFTGMTFYRRLEIIIFVKHMKNLNLNEFWHFMNILNGRLVRTIQIDRIILFVFVAALVAVKTAVAVLFQRQFV